MPQQYLAKLYPAVTQSDAAQPVLGICLSGGGSRALSCALGQLSALNAMTLPNGQPILGPSQYVSSVSGGSWASVLYTFLPQAINGTSVSDADFLIEPVAPGSLTKGDPSTNTPGNVSYIGKYCLGTTPQQFSLANIGVFLKTLADSLFFTQPSQWGWFWIAGVGELVLKPFALYSATYNSNGPFVQPSLMFSLSPDEVNQSITRYNPSLGPTDFYLARPGRPSLIVNTNLLENYLLPSSPQIPVQATPVATSVLGHSPDGTVLGGGGVESFGFTSTLIGASTMSGTASVTTNRNYSLCDIAGCSSAFFAEFLLQYINDGLDDIITDLENYLINDLHWTQTEADIAGAALELAVEYFVDTNAADLIPKYNYWSVGQVSSPSNNTLGFSDGGDFDNTGVLGLLAQTNANKIIAFVNTEIALNGQPPNLTMDNSIGLLFGYGGAGPGDLSFIQVFDDSNPLYPGGAFAAAQTGLYDASCGGSTLGTATAAFLQKGLVTIANPVANIAAGRIVDVLWVYNNPVSNWQKAIGDQGIQQDLNNVSVQGTPLWNFPNYFTGEQIYLGVEAVNMLAQLSAWNVQQLSGTIASWLGS